MWAAESRAARHTRARACRTRRPRGGKAERRKRPRGALQVVKDEEEMERLMARAAEDANEDALMVTWRS